MNRHQSVKLLPYKHNRSNVMFDVEQCRQQILLFVNWIVVFFLFTSHASERYTHARTHARRIKYTRTALWRAGVWFNGDVVYSEADAVVVVLVLLLLLLIALYSAMGCSRGRLTVLVLILLLLIALYSAMGCSRGRLTVLVLLLLLLIALYSAMVCSRGRLTPLMSHVILNEWLSFDND